MAEPALPQKPETPPRLPAQAPVIPPRRSPPPLSLQPAFSAVLHPLPTPVPVPPAPSAPPLLPRAQVPENFGDLPVQSSPKKETARIAILPRPSPSPAIVSPAPALAATSKGIDAFDSLPRWFCWGLLGLSVIIFLTQIWNYALS